MILAIDPGTIQSAWLTFEKGEPVQFGIDRNEYIVEIIKNSTLAYLLAIEMIASYGMPVGREVFETVLWIGRFMQAKEPDRHALVYRREVKAHLCNSQRAKDSNIRQALIDKFGGTEKAIGKKAKPGPLHGIKADIWSALAIAVTYAETKENQ